MSSWARGIAASALALIGPLVALYFGSGGGASCLGGLTGGWARCVAEHWGFATEGAVVPLVAGAWATAVLIRLLPRRSPRLLAMAVPGGMCGLVLWLGTREWTLTEHPPFGPDVTVFLRPTVEVGAWWAVGGALVAIAATAFVTHRRA